MPDKPLLIFPQPENVDVPPGRGGGAMPPKPLLNKNRKTKFSDKFEAAVNYIQSISGNVNPEMVLVLETIGKIQDFHKAVKRFEGLEWLAEVDLDEIEIEDDFYDTEEDRQKAAKKGGRLYLISSNRSGLDKIVRLWKKHIKNENLDYGSGKWKYIFNYISEIRPWNKNDRAEETGVLEYLREEIEIKKDSPESTISFEIELHFWESQTKAERIESTISAAVANKGGQVGKIARIPDIGFHAVKATVSVLVAGEIYDSYSAANDAGQHELINMDEIKYLRPIYQQLIQGDEILAHPEEIPVSEVTDQPPVIALFDGLPIVTHDLLKDRLTVDDPDNFSVSYSPGKRKHGTAMASLICHDDLNNPERKSLSRRIYVRPIMQPHEFVNREEIPASEFPEDLVERAVIRILGGQETPEGVATSVQIINLSLGHIDYPFLGEMSSWARLLDWLSWKYKVLFIVSAGNFSEGFQVTIDNKSISEQVITEMGKSIRNRKILSPAESINSLTVGAVHSDYSAIPSDDQRIDVFHDKRLMAEYSRLGAGYRRSIKPEILVAGGRQLFSSTVTNNKASYERDKRLDAPGQKFAGEGLLPEDVQNTTYGKGTSNAAALTTHAAGILYDVVQELRSDSPSGIPEEYDVLLIKSLLVHGADWREMPKSLDVLKSDVNRMRFKRVISQYLGYGEADFSRVMECTAQRVTALGFGKLQEKTRHRFVLPIPDNCKGIHYKLVATLAYFTPINPFHFNYRMAKVFFDSPVIRGNSRKADHQQVQNGTLQHEIVDLQNVVDNNIEFFVQCNKDAADSLDEEIPYALSLTLEAEEETSIDIYTAIKTQIETQVGI